MVEVAELIPDRSEPTVPAGSLFTAIASIKYPVIRMVRILTSSCTPTKIEQKNIPGIVYLGFGDYDKTSPMFTLTEAYLNLTIFTKPSLY